MHNKEYFNKHYRNLLDKKGFNQGNNRYDSESDNNESQYF